MIDEKRLAEIEKRAAKATPGPWSYEPGEYDCNRECGKEWRDDCADDTVMACPHMRQYCQAGVPEPFTIDCGDYYGLSDDNALFIAHAREDIPDLCAAIREAWREVDRQRERANAIQLAWDSHRDMDCAVKCAKEIEVLLGTSDPVEAAKRIRALKRVAEAAERLCDFVAPLWAGVWVHLNRIGGFNKPNPWRELVLAARERRVRDGQTLAPAAGAVAGERAGSHAVDHGADPDADPGDRGPAMHDGVVHEGYEITQFEPEV